VSLSKLFYDFFSLISFKDHDPGNVILSKIYVKVQNRVLVSKTCAAWRSLWILHLLFLGAWSMY